MWPVSVWKVSCVCSFLLQSVSVSQLWQEISLNDHSLINVRCSWFLHTDPPEDVCDAYAWSFITISASAAKRRDVWCVRGVDGWWSLPLPDLHPGVPRRVPEGAGLPPSWSPARDARHSQNQQGLELLLLCEWTPTPGLIKKNHKEDDTPSTEKHSLQNNLVPNVRLMTTFGFSVWWKHFYLKTAETQEYKPRISLLRNTEAIQNSVQMYK